MEFSSLGATQASAQGSLFNPQANEPLAVSLFQCNSAAGIPHSEFGFAAPRWVPPPLRDVGPNLMMGQYPISEPCLVHLSVDGFHPYSEMTDPIWWCVNMLECCLIFQEEMMVQENPIELEKTMAWSRRSKSRWSGFLFRRLRVSFSGEVWTGFNSYSIKAYF